MRTDVVTQPRYGLVEVYNVEAEQFHTYLAGTKERGAVLVHNGVLGAGGCGITKAAAPEDLAATPVAIEGAMSGDIHRIGGGTVENLRLKPAEAALNPAGISVLKSPTPGEAAAQMRTAFPRAAGLHKAAKTVGSTTEEAIRSVGFESIASPTRKLPNHYRIIRPEGVAGFSDENLANLASVFTNTTGH